jgi:hypothetical protein
MSWTTNANSARFSTNQKIGTVGQQQKTKAPKLSGEGKIFEL